jgi:Sec-independent protein translocase protein TatA
MQAPSRLGFFARRLLLVIGEIKKAVQDLAKAVTEAGKTAHTQQDPAPLVRAEVNLPEGIEIRKSASDAQSDKNYEFRTLLVSSLTLVAIVIYAVISGWQLWEMKKATTAATESANAATTSLHLDQRAWVGAGGGKFLIDAKELKVEFTVANVGKSPASDVVSNIAWIGKVKGENLYPGDILYPREDGQNGTMFPTQTFQLRNSLPDPIDPYQSSYVDQLRRGDKVLFVFGRIRYRDIFAVWRWTHFCVVVQQDLTTDSPCSFYNDTDSDQNQKDDYGAATPN